MFLLFWLFNLVLKIGNHVAANIHLTIVKKRNLIKSSHNETLGLRKILIVLE